jgi:(2Fe-2S) ferredoxin
MKNRKPTASSASSNVSAPENRVEMPLLASDQIRQLSVLQRRSAAKPTVYVGAGTCGLGAGAGHTIKAVRNWLDVRQIDGEVVRVGCIGLCAAEPILDVQLPGYKRISFAGVQQSDVDELLDRVFQLEVDSTRVLGQFEDTEGKGWEGVPALSSIPFFRPQQRLVLRNCGILDPTSIDEYIADGRLRRPAHPDARYLQPAEVCDIIEKSGLRGRGGGGFLTGAKWKMALATPSEEKYLICNADEGDPGAFMDRAVIEGDPHRLVEGMASPPTPSGASKAYVYIRAEYPLAIERLQIALRQAEKGTFMGRTSFGAGFDLRNPCQDGGRGVRMRRGNGPDPQHRGQARHAAPRPPYPSISGLFGKPTVINNVETLANVSGILEREPGMVQQHRHGDQQGHQGLRPVGQGRLHRPGRSRHGHQPAANRLRHRRRHPPTASCTRPSRSAARRAAASRSSTSTSRSTTSRSRRSAP